jgi:hypothetical protein
LLNIETTQRNHRTERNFTSAQILPTVVIVSTGYNPPRVSAPRIMASLPKREETEIHD